MILYVVGLEEITQDITVFVDGKKYKTHLIPSGIFFGIKSIIGPGCVVNIKAFEKEIKYLKDNGFNTNLIKVSKKAHVILQEHIEEDINKYKDLLGTTANGIAPCYRAKYGRTGKRVEDYMDYFSEFIWDEQLYGYVLCEGAQGFWLDIIHILQAVPPYHMMRVVLVFRHN